MPTVAGEQPLGRLATKSTPVIAKCIEQSLTQHHIAIAVPLTTMDVNHHPLAVDVTDLQMCGFDAARSSAIERHEQNAIERLLRCIDEAIGFFPVPLPTVAFMPASFSRTTSPAAERLGLKGVGWHTFRHLYRTWLDDTGAPIGVQLKLMRHAQIGTTMNVYGTALMEAEREANSKVVRRALRLSPETEERAETPGN